MESRAGFLLLKEEQKLEKEMNGYMNWICKAGKDNLAAAENSPPSLKTASLTSFGQLRVKDHELAKTSLAHSRQSLASRRDNDDALSLSQIPFLGTDPTMA